jgi:hypothetical protein
MTYMKTPSILLEIANFIKKAPRDMSNTDRDGRINSKLDESNIIELLATQFGNKVIQKVKERMAGDILVSDGKSNYVVNIKTTFGQAADNAYSAGGFLIAFTNIAYDSVPDRMTFTKMAKLLTSHKNSTDRDYWFLVISKDIANQQVILRGLKELNNVVANPSNTLQVHWGKEFATKPSVRSFEESYKKLVIDTVCESHKRKVKAINEGLDHFGLTA